MRSHAVPAARQPLPDLRSEAFDPEGCAFTRAHSRLCIDRYAWDASGYRPEAWASLAWAPEGLDVLMCAREQTVRASVKAFNGPVWTDSCLECFLQPFLENARYLNVEVNPLGTALIGIGPDRERRELLPSMPEGMRMQTAVCAGAWWAVAYRIPNTLLVRLFGKAPAPGGIMRGNFYSCDESIHPHFGAWNAIENPVPDFHRPECFGMLVLPQTGKGER